MTPGELQALLDGALETAKRLIDVAGSEKPTDTELRAQIWQFIVHEHPEWMADGGRS